MTRNFEPSEQELDDKALELFEQDVDKETLLLMFFKDVIDGDTLVARLYELKEHAHDDAATALADEDLMAEPEGLEDYQCEFDY